jgi:diaminopimelate epimerase
MTMLHFYKYQGAGNDFIVFDNRSGAINHQKPSWVQGLCNRRFGIGADGLILLESHPDFDFEMVYYNADGQPSSMCGNGGRCAVAFAKKLGIIRNETTFLAVDGPHYAHCSEDGSWVSLQMIDVSVLERDGEAWVLNTGSPHYVSTVQNLSQLDVYNGGKAIRYNNTYAEKGINVNFIEEENTGYAVRTYERGVEDETLACGTGVTAVALAMAKEKGLIGTHNTPISVRGGALNVRFTFDGSTFTEVFLEGPATLVFEGDIQH